MSAGWVAVLVGAAALAVFVVLALRLTRMLRELHAAVDELRREAVPLLADMHRMVERATDDLDRVEDLLDTADGLRESAGRIGSTIETAATLSSSPLVRFVGMVARLRSRGRGG